MLTRTIFWAWLAVHVSAFLIQPQTPPKVKALPPIRWDAIEPSNDLIYHDCFEGNELASFDSSIPIVHTAQAGRFQCARLILPLDWQNATNNNSVILAVTRLQAKVTETDPSHGGPVILNPGGPGGSGVDLVLGAGEVLQNTMDDAKHFEMLSFDPRGIGASHPKADCFRDALGAEIFEVKMKAAGNLGADSETLRMHWSAKEGLGALCAADGVSGYANGDNIRAYMSTTTVVRDILELVHKADEARGRAIAERGRSSSRQVPISKSNVKLQYFGGSYGTVIGNYFASMYPQHVHRMILDSNCDADDWVESGLVNNVLDDTEKVWHAFSDACFSSRSACAMWRPDDTSALDVWLRIQTLFEGLHEHPGYTTHNQDLRLVTLDDVRRGIFVSLYQPRISWAPLARILDAMLRGNFSTHFPSDSRIRPICPPDPHAPSNPFRVEGVSSSVECGDMRPAPPDFSPADLLQILNETARLSPNFGSMFAEYALGCALWPERLRPAWRFEGPFGTSKDNNTDAPVLFVNNQLDPVTPLGNAYKMAEKYHGAVVLEQASVGHGAILVPSKCRVEVIRRYMDEGKMPEAGTVCPGDCVPFEECDSEMAVDLFGLDGNGE